MLEKLLRESKDVFPTQTVLFEKLKITSHTAFSYVFGDHLDGYYEGKTHLNFEAGHYHHRAGTLLGGFLSFVGESTQDKRHASEAMLWPYGIEHSFDDGSRNLLSLISGHRIACIEVHHTSPEHLSILPQLNLSPTQCDIDIESQTIVIKIKKDFQRDGVPTTIVITANQPLLAQPVRHSTLINSLPEQIVRSLSLDLLLRTEEKCSHFAIYLAFGFDKDATLKAAKHAVEQNALKQNRSQLYQYLLSNYLWTDDDEYNRALMWARISSKTFINKEYGDNIWAGLPWFKDCWGRDTFIALPGICLTNGMWDVAKSIIHNFSSMQKNDFESIYHGRIPNRVTSAHNRIYNTTDGTPWMIREIMEYVNYSGDLALTTALYPTIKEFVLGVQRHYLSDDGMLTHANPDTWMDAKIDDQIPWSPRGPKANDIQALWFESLGIAQRFALWNDDPEFASLCEQLSQQVKREFLSKFWNQEKKQLADHLRESDAPDYSIRPNQLMTITIPTTVPLVDDDMAQHIIKSAVSHLLFPWGICSLQQEHQDFHPYHDKRSEYHKDAAYHNGTIWGWNAGFTISALTQYGQQELAYTLTQRLSSQILNQGHRGTMSENLDAYQENTDQLIESGTYSQAWSVSEFARNAQQDYVGFKPRLTQNKILLSPHFPNQWHTLVTRLPFGKNALLLSYCKSGDIEEYKIQSESLLVGIQLELSLTSQRHTSVALTYLSEPLHLSLSRTTGEVRVLSGQCNLNHKPLKQYLTLRNLDYALPNPNIEHRSLSEEHYLLRKRLNPTASA